MILREHDDRRTRVPDAGRSCLGRRVELCNTHVLPAPELTDIRQIRRPGGRHEDELDAIADVLGGQGVRLRRTVAMRSGTSTMAESDGDGWDAVSVMGGGTRSGRSGPSGRSGRAGPAGRAGRGVAIATRRPVSIDSRAASTAARLARPSSGPGLTRRRSRTAAKKRPSAMRNDGSCHGSRSLRSTYGA